MLYLYGFVGGVGRHGVEYCARDDDSYIQRAHHSARHCPFRVCLMLALISCQMKFGAMCFCVVFEAASPAFNFVWQFSPRLLHGFQTVTLA